MKIYKVKYTLNENLCWSRVEARNPQEAAEKVYRQISEAYPDDEYEYMDVESDFDDGGVRVDDSFIEDGNEYTFIARVGDVVHLDFDNWAVWAARNEDTSEINFFIVDEDTGFIDWGPVDSAQEATEFLQSKISDWEDDDNIDDIESEFSLFEDSHDDLSPQDTRLLAYTRALKDVACRKQEGQDVDVFEECDKIASTYSLPLAKVKQDLNKIYNKCNSKSTQLTEDEKSIAFNDKYFPRVDVNNTSRYDTTEFKDKFFAYDKANNVLIYLFKDDEEVSEMGWDNAPWRELDSAGLSSDNWNDKESREDYLHAYTFDLDSESSYLVQDFIDNELPYYQSKNEALSSFEDLENPTPEDSLAAPIQEGPQAGLASVVNSLIVDEYEAIDGYTSAIATARAEGYEDVAKVLEDISSEESVHVGQLQEVMKLFDPGAVKVDDGAAEAAEQLNNLDDEI